MRSQDITDSLIQYIDNDEGLYNLCRDMRADDLEEHFMEAWKIEHPYGNTLHLTPDGEDLNQVFWPDVEDHCKSEEDCEHCGNRWDECDCTECKECDEKGDDCDCEKCECCDQLVDDCQCICDMCDKKDCECDEETNPCEGEIGGEELDPRLK